MRYLLDTHTWIWWHLNPDKLSARTRTIIADNKNYEELLLSVISTWEFCKLMEKKKLRISLQGNLWMKRSFDLLPLRIVPLTPETVWHSTTLPQPFHDDPADQIIVATARFEEAVILTRDKLIQDYPHVQSVW